MKGRNGQMAVNTLVTLAYTAAVVLFLFGLVDGLPWLWRHL